MAFKQKEARRLSRANKQGNVERRGATVRDTNVLHVRRQVAGTQQSKHPFGRSQIFNSAPLVWATVSTLHGVWAKPDVTTASVDARTSAVLYADVRCHVEQVPFNHCEQAKTMTYQQWLRRSATR